MRFLTNLILRPTMALAVLSALAATSLAQDKPVAPADPVPAAKRADPRRANPFVPAGATQEWNHRRTSLFAKAKTANHRGQDVIVQKGAEQVLIGKFGYGVSDKDLKDEQVEVFMQNEPPFGDWLSFGTAWTSTDGEYGSQYGIEDDGGRVFFTIPQNRRKAVGFHPVRMVTRGDHTMAKLNLFVFEPGTQAVVFDIDGTLTTSDKEVTKEVLYRLVSKENVPEMRPDSVEVAREWANKGYFIVYVTGRPDNMRELSREWLIDQGFPPGAIHCTDHLRQAVPKSSGVGKFKADFLKLLKNRGLNIVAAYGNAPTDIEAYHEAGIPKTKTYIVGPNAGHDDTVALDGYTNHLESARALAETVNRFPMPEGWW